MHMTELLRLLTSSQWWRRGVAANINAVYLEVKVVSRDVEGSGGGGGGGRRENLENLEGVREGFIRPRRLV